MNGYCLSGKWRRRGKALVTNTAGWDGISSVPNTNGFLEKSRFVHKHKGIVILSSLSQSFKKSLMLCYTTLCFFYKWYVCKM